MRTDGGSRRRRGARWWLLAPALALLGCAGPTPRDPAVVAAIETGAARHAAETGERVELETRTFFQRYEAIARGETADSTYDALFFSGGAEWGAFGAGYTARWAELGDAAALAMPEFDMVAGISTGALMAAFVASGEPERYAALEAFYRNVSPDWIEPNSLLVDLMPGTVSLVDNAGIREEIDAAVDDALIADLAAAHGANRQILIGTLNLDYATRQYWNIARIAAEHPDPKPRIAAILLAATAIAGLFPPVEIDGVLYADLGYVEGIPAFNRASLELFERSWREAYGAADPPTMRLWLVYNIAVGVQAEAVELSVVPLAMRGYQALVQASFTNPVAGALLLEEVSEQRRAPVLEVRWIAIPPSFDVDPDVPAFDPRTTNALADLGRAAADRPDGGWRTDAP